MSPSPPTTATPVASHHQHHRYPSPHHPHRLHLAIISPTRKPPSLPPRHSRDATTKRVCLAADFITIRGVWFYRNAADRVRVVFIAGNMGAFGLLWKLGCVWFTQKLQRERLAVAQPWGAFGCGSTTRLGRLAGTTTQGVFGLLFRGTGAFGCGFNSRRDCLVHGSRKGVFGFGMTK
ncbi:hypothetical protein Tco_0603682 [Tanacetum coccineum]|uniref:Uncharacterized protein n=1 Tax=Tanacetum coccineum TaxID=301880 RepID=A0ABQ4Z318_9ASTR